MNGNPTGGHNGLATTPQEEMLLIHLGAGVLTVLIGSVGVFWLKGAAWLVVHRVLVPASARPLLTVPRAAGAGLDLPRAAIVVAVIAAALAFAVSAARRALSSREELG